MKSRWAPALLGLLLGLAAGFALRPAYQPAAAHPRAPAGYVVDVADGNAGTWHTALNAAKLVHAAYPSVPIEVVAHGAGIQMLLASSPVAPDLQTLAAGGGVELAACANAMQTYGITAAQLVAQARVVPAGVVEVARREAEGYLYINAA